MASFDYSIDLIFKVEGGYSNHPKDNGGATKFGITQHTLNVYNKFSTDGHPATLLVKDLSAFEAREIYQNMFWDPLSLSEIEDQKLAHILFDQAINQGGQVAVRRFQHAYNYVARGCVKLSEDGIVGPLTLVAINSCPSKNRMGLEFIKLCQHYYVNIVKVQPNQIAFLSGWIARSHKLIDLLVFSRSSL